MSTPDNKDPQTVGQQDDGRQQETPSIGHLALTLTRLKEMGPGTHITVYDLRLGLVAQGEVQSVDDDVLWLTDTSGHNQNQFTTQSAGLRGGKGPLDLDIFTILTADLPELQELLDDGSLGAEEEH